jgi:ABC-type transporter Mla subunit MlaD
VSTISRGGPRRQGGLLHNRVLIGAVTVLVLIGAVVVAFRTTNSLPFAPSYTLHLEVTNAEELTKGSEVHLEGGQLIGFVTTVRPMHGPHDTPVALITVQLDKSIAPLPRNSRFTIRLKGTIGSKYVDVTLGHGTRMWAAGATVPLADTGASVDLDQVLDMFNPPTRTGVQNSAIGLGDALAGRGDAINSAIGALKPLTAVLTPVMTNLAAPATNLTGFIRSLGALSAALAPVAGAQASAVRGLDTTFTALARAARPYLQEFIADTPGALNTTTADAPTIARLAGSTAHLFAALNPGLSTLPTAAPILADAVAAGNRNLPATAGLDRRIVSLSATLANYSADPTVQTGLDRLTLTATSLKAPLAYLTPVQARCDYVTTLLGNLSSTLGDNVGNGTVLRFVLVAIDDVTGGEAVPSQTPYLSTSTAGGSHHAPLHVNAYPYTSSPGQPAVCGAGNEHFSASRAQTDASDS